MKFINNHKITSFSAPKNTKTAARGFNFAELSNHKNANKNTILPGYNTPIGNQVKFIKIPFSAYIKIDDFLQPPIFGHTTQHSLNFKDQTDFNSDFETYQLNTTTYYHEQPYGRLVFSNVHAMMDLNNESSKTPTKNNNCQQEITKPIKQNSHPQEMDDIFNNTFPFATFHAPVVLGEYDIGIILEENTLIDKGIVKILDVSKEVVLTNCKFLPSSFTHSSDPAKRTASNGILFVEGFIQESMEYLPAINREKISPRKWLKNVYYQVHQKIMIDLKIQLLQLVQIGNCHKN